MFKKVIILSCMLIQLNFAMDKEIVTKSAVDNNEQKKHILHIITHIPGIHDIIMGYINHWQKGKQIRFGQHQHFMHVCESTVNTLHFLPGLPVLARVNNQPDPILRIHKKSAIKTINLKTNNEQVAIIPAAEFRLHNITMTCANSRMGGDATEPMDSWNIGGTKDRYDAYAIAIAPEQNYFALAVSWAANGDYTTLPVFDTKTGQYVCTLKPKVLPIFALAFSRDGKHLASGSHKGLIEIWDIQTGTVKYELNKHTGAIYVLAFHDGCLLSASHDGSVIIWDLKTGTYIETLVQYQKPVTSLAVSSNGQYLAMSTTNRLVEVPSDGKRMAFIKSPDGEMVDIYENQKFQLENA